MQRRYAQALAAVIVALLVLALSACGGSDGSSYGNVSTDTATTGDPTPETGGTGSGYGSYG